MKLSPRVRALEDAFDILNTEYFEGALSKSIITISPTPGAYGHFTPWKSWGDGNELAHEINLGAETLDRDLHELLATLQHEMVHQYCHENDIQDTSRGNTYHNKKFRDECEKRGLSVEQEPRIGWGRTRATAEFRAFAESGRFDECAGRLHRLGGTRQKDPSSGKKSSSTRKYKCPSCGISVRATKEVRIGCLDCDEEMELA